MSFKLSKTEDDGQSYEHWEVHKIVKDFETGRLDVRLKIFKDATAQSDGKAGIPFDVILEGSDLPTSLTTADIETAVRKLTDEHGINFTTATNS